MPSDKHPVRTPRPLLYGMVEMMALMAGGFGFAAGALAAGYLNLGVVTAGSLGIAVGFVGAIQHTRLRMEADKYD